MIRVAHYHETGVAWVPSRIQHVLEGSDEIEVDVYSPNPERLERYGLPTKVRTSGLHEVLGAGYDVVHLHHAIAAERQLARANYVFDRRPVVVLTIHGEPDRSAPHLRVHPAVGAIHVVEPLLRQRLEGESRPVVYIPNHPGFQRRSSSQRLAGDRRAWCPASHVPEFKDRAVRDRVFARLREVGWSCEVAGFIAGNARVRDELRASAACWVQLRGYLDLLTMECWQERCLPIVRRPPPEALEEMAAFWGELPPLPFYGDTLDELEERIVAEVSGGGYDPEPAAAFMERVWTPERARASWESFYREALSWS